MRSKQLGYALIGYVTLAVAGCSSLSGPNLSLCSSSVALTFTVSPASTLSWTPNCRVDQVIVDVPLPPSLGGGSHVTWQIAARVEGAGVAAPLRYGVVPRGMQELATAEALQAGAFYRIRIYATEVAVGELHLQYWPPD